MTGKKEATGTKSSSRKIVGGVITILLSPILYFVVIIITELLCNNSCSIGQGMQGAVVAIGLPIISGIVGFILIISGAIGSLSQSK